MPLNLVLFLFWALANLQQAKVVGSPFSTLSNREVTSCLLPYGKMPGSRSMYLPILWWCNQSIVFFYFLKYFFDKITLHLRVENRLPWIFFSTWKYWNFFFNFFLCVCLERKENMKYLVLQAQTFGLNKWQTMKHFFCLFNTRRKLMYPQISLSSHI